MVVAVREEEQMEPWAVEPESFEDAGGGFFFDTPTKFFSVNVKTGSMADWKLQNCCDRQQVAFVATVGVYIFVILALWRTPLLTPFKLITVYLHEVSHALAAKLTCGKVEGIEVNLNEGGVTHTRGGMMCCILPAGYMGSAFWGMVLIVMSPNSISVRVAAAVLIASLIVTFFLARNWTLRWLCLEITNVKLLRYTILFIGTMNCMFAVYDIYDDLISRRVHTSDAEKFAELYPLCPCNGVGWGVLWGIFSFLCLCAAVYLGLVILD
ncbi:hypothetical protein R1flu_023381 [Riccia fluitans]|uniref:Peptidase M50B-like protein n=1 Tax=Riccia fluitans TaxID=41844 RepID=A0ABD1XRV7_9MARC